MFSGFRASSIRHRQRCQQSHVHEQSQGSEPSEHDGGDETPREKPVTAGNKHSSRADLRLGSVRFGNVIGSLGSVIPLSEQQIQDGGPVTLTNPDMTRFFLTESQMADLVLSATGLTEGGEVFIRKMVAMNIKRWQQ